jgi:hypothetical protein
MRGRAICACYALYAESPFTVSHKIQQIHVWALPSVVWKNCATCGSNPLAKLRCARPAYGGEIAIAPLVYAFYVFYALRVLFSVLGSPCKRYVVTPTHMPLYEVCTRVPVVLQSS